MMKRWLGIAVVLGMTAVSLIVYDALPVRMPTHWNIRGEVDGWSPRFWGAFLMPLLAAGLWLFMPLLRRIDRRGRSYERFDTTFWLVINVLMVFLAVIHVLTLLAALGMNVDVSRTSLVLIGLLFVVFGHQLPRLEPNWWMGIRTPWTMKSDRVWRATHRLAGRTFMIGGGIAIVSAALPSGLALPVGMSTLAVAALIPIPYSWAAYRRETGDDAGGRRSGGA
ncbi:MAG: SdpI family protein [Gemmatimonadota bacterium]